MAEKKYYIRIHNTLVPVTSDVYKAYHSTKRSEKTLNEKDERNGLVSYNALDTADILGEEIVYDAEALSVENIAVNNVLCDKLRRCLDMLPEKERELIKALYFEELSERQFAEQTGNHYMTIHNRKVRILRKLKIMMDK